MSAECYRVRVPEGRQLSGYTVTGQRVPILPGGYHVHRLPLKMPSAGGGALRFVGAHGRDGDVHIKLPDGADIDTALSVEARRVEEIESAIR